MSVAYGPNRSNSKVLAKNSQLYGFNSVEIVAAAPAPLVHAASRKMQREFYAVYAAFVGAFYEAVERLNAGAHNPEFPDGVFPPPLLLAPG